MNHIRAILNPNSGSAEDEDREALCNRLDALLGAHVVCTEAEGDAKRLAREACDDGVELLVVVGGDGTAHEVVNGLMDAEASTRPRVALIPMGTGNDLARSLELPKSMDEAAEVALHGTADPMDLIRIDHMAGVTDEDLKPLPGYMHNAATGGFSTVARENLDDDAKSRWGAIAYLMAAVKALHEIPDFEVTAEADGETLTTKACAVVVANGSFAGGGMQLVPAAEVDDRRLDLMVVNSKTFFERAATTARFVFHQHEDDEHVITRSVKSVTIRSEPTMRFSIDGEPAGQTPITFTLEPAALRVMRPTGDTPRR